MEYSINQSKTAALPSYRIVPGRDSIIRTYGISLPELQGENTYENVVSLSTRLKEISGGSPILLLHDPTALPMMSSNARKFLVKWGNENIKALAVVSNDSMSRLVVNFMIHVDQPQFPIKLFEDQDQAKNWLLRHDGRLHSD